MKMKTWKNKKIFYKKNLHYKNFANILLFLIKLKLFLTLIKTSEVHKINEKINHFRLQDTLIEIKQKNLSWIDLDELI